MITVKEIIITRASVSRQLQLAAALFTAAFFSSCNIINPAEPVPSYVHVDSFNLTSTSSLGSTSNKISDVYVYIDNEFQGGYPVTSTIPIVESGSHEMQFYPGIAINGISNTRFPYPFYEPLIETVNLKQGEITTITPSIKYGSSTVCAWCEDFENAGITLIKSESSDTGIVSLPPGDPNNFEGVSGAVYLDDAHPFFELITTSAYDLPGAGSPVYLEMNYKCNNTFVVGMIANSSGNLTEFPVITINIKENWNKIYIELAPSITAYYFADDFKIFIGATKNEGVSKAEFFFDNLKLLHN